MYINKEQVYPGRLEIIRIAEMRDVLIACLEDNILNKEQVYPDLPRNDLHGNSSRAWKSRGSRGSGTLRHMACRVGLWTLLRLGSAWYMLFFKDYKHKDIVYNNPLKLWSSTVVQVLLYFWFVIFFQQFCTKVQTQSSISASF